MAVLRLWAFWRRVQYAVGFFLVSTFLIIAVYAIFVVQPPSCFDLVKNGDEGGVDCDGSCVRMCSTSVMPPVVSWVRSFKVTDGQYNAVAYIENKNPVAATPAMNYTLSLHDANGLITERKGTTILPPDSVYPIFESRIQTGDRIPTQTFIDIEPPELWIPAEYGRNQFRVVSREIFSADFEPRLEAVIENTALTPARDVEIVTTIFDSRGNALTSSRTDIDNFAPRTRENIVFTWPEPIAKTVRSCEVPSDILVMLDRSGSMAADGGEPPEPLESAKRSAEDFVRQIGQNDQVAFLSYATTPSFPIEQTLTNNKNQAINAIANTKMGEDGVQYTNMGEAFKVALAELTSSRHQEDSRKVLIMLTDGDVTRPLNDQGERDLEFAAEYARQAATQVKDSDVLVYTIGFGDFVRQTGDDINRDVELIRGLASSPDMYFEAPTISDLKRVYQQIARDICEDGIAKIDIIPKTSASFTPLR